MGDLPRSLAFYELLGLHEVARRDFGEGPRAFLSTGNAHHDLALVETNAPSGGALHHFALKVGDSLTALADARAALDAAGLTVHMALDHKVSQGLYITDPDGNMIELYVDAPQVVARRPIARGKLGSPRALIGAGRCGVCSATRCRSARRRESTRA